MAHCCTRPAAAGRHRPPHEAVRRLAYRIWEAAGRPHGRDLDVWLLAEDMLACAAPRVPCHRHHHHEGHRR